MAISRQTLGHKESKNFNNYYRELISKFTFVFRILYKIAKISSSIQKDDVVSVLKQEFVLRSGRGCGPKEEKKGL